MSYTAVPTQNIGDEWTAAEHNTYVRDNFAAGIPDIFTTKGDLAAASAADVAGRLGVGANGTSLLADSGETLGMKWAGAGPFIRYTKGTDQTIASGAAAEVIDYDTETFDTGDDVTIGAAWHFDVPVGGAGYYLISVSGVFESSAAWGVAEYVRLSLYKGGVEDCVIAERYMQAAATVAVYVHGAMIISLADEDVVDIRCTQNSGSNLVYDGGTSASRVCIARLI